MILIVLYVGLVASYGMRASFGAYISPWEKEFSASRTMVTSISMFSFVVYAIAQPIVGKLNDHFGKNIIPSVGIFLLGVSLLLTSQARQIWQVFVLFGVLFSLGVACCCNVVTSAVISNWFIEKRGFAIGLTTSGMAVGQLILVPVNMSIIDKLGWRTTMAALSIVVMVVVSPLFIFLLRSKPEEKGMKPYGYVGPVDDSLAVVPHSGGSPIDDSLADVTLTDVTLTDVTLTDVTRSSVSGAADAASGDSLAAVGPLPVLRALRSKAFWLLTIPYFICGFTDVGLIQTHLIPMSEGRGFPSATVAAAFSVIAAFNIAGSIVTGHLADRFNRKRQLAVIYAVRAFTCVFLIFLKLPWLLIPFAVVYGSMEMASIAPTNSLTVHLFDKFSIGAVLGLVSVSHQLGGAVGSWVPGVLFDMTGSYFAVLALSVVLLLGISALSLRIPEK